MIDTNRPSGARALQLAGELNYKFSRQARACLEAADRLAEFTRNTLHNRSATHALTVELEAEQPDVTKLPTLLDAALAEQQAANSGLLDRGVTRAAELRTTALQHDAAPLLDAIGKKAGPHLKTITDNATSVRHLNPSDTEQLAGTDPATFATLAEVRGALEALKPLLDGAADLLAVLGRGGNNAQTKAKLLAVDPKIGNELAEGMRAFSGSPLGPLHILLVLAADHPGAIGLNSLRAVELHEARAARDHAQVQFNYVTQQPATGDIDEYQSKLDKAEQRVQELEAAAA